MTRDEYMKELEYLLQDIQDEDKEDALQYYRDYFDEAGPQKEEEIIDELGSPERIASMIRCDIAGHLERGGEFTENGYQDERFRDPNFQLARRYDLPEEQGGTEAGRQDYGGPAGQTQENRRKASPRTSGPLKVILWVILILAASPFLIGLGGGLLGIAAGAGGILIAIMAVTGVMTVAMAATGIVMIPVGIITIFSHPLDGIMTAGTGLAFMGLGFLFLALSVLFYGRFLPWLFRVIIDGISRLFHRGRCA
ncbi:MAG: DUF1700 domain-containing protein [Clostridium sp.]|nr:DUF1700 domain-containing protein [Clostridium sp.]